jgi:hypothetical protein
MQKEYAVPGGTLRENLTRKPGQNHLMDDHYGATYAWERNPGPEIKPTVSDEEMIEKTSAKVRIAEGSDPVEETVSRKRVKLTNGSASSRSEVVA